MGGEEGRGRGAWLPSLLRTRRGHTGAAASVATRARQVNTNNPRSSDRTELSPALVCRSQTTLITFVGLRQLSTPYSPLPFLCPCFLVSSFVCQRSRRRARVRAFAPPCHVLLPNWANEGRNMSASARPRRTPSPGPSVMPLRDPGCTPSQSSLSDHTCGSVRMLGWQRVGERGGRGQSGTRPWAWGGRSTSDHKIRFSRSPGQL